MVALRKLGPFVHEILLAVLLVGLLLVAAKIDEKGFVSADNQQSFFFNVWDLAALVDTDDVHHHHRWD